MYIFQILTQVPTILKEEEDEAYSNEVGFSDTDDVIVKQHNAAVRTIAIGHIVEKVSMIFTIQILTFWVVHLINKLFLF